MKIAVTGASGYIGQRLVAAALRQGLQVVALSRKHAAGVGLSWIPFDLSERGPLSLPEDVEVLFHLAADVGGLGLSDDSEIESAKRLISATTDRGARFVFVSSQTSRPDAPTRYGRTKWRIEQLVLAAGGVVVRPGQVYGGPERGLFGELCRLVNKLPVLPGFLPDAKVQPVHVDDLVAGLLSAARQPDATVLCVAEKDPIDFSRFLMAVARGRSRRLPVVMPLPSGLIRYVSRLPGTALRQKLGLERLDSLFELQGMDTSADMDRLGIAPRPLLNGVTRSGRGRRELIREGGLLLGYILGSRPEPSLLRRYVRAIEDLRGQRSLQIPASILRLPVLLAVLDNAWYLDRDYRREFEARLHVAMFLSEATRQGALRFLGTKDRSPFLLSALSLGLVVFKEVMRRLAQFAFFPAFSGIGRNGVFLS